MTTSKRMICRDSYEESTTREQWFAHEPTTGRCASVRVELENTSTSYTSARFTGKFVVRYSLAASVKSCAKWYRRVCDSESEAREYAEAKWSELLDKL